MDEIIRVAFSPDGRAARTSSIWQYDRGRKLQITGLELPASYEVQFANCPHATAKRVVVYDTDTVEIPEEFTQMGEPVYVYIYIVGDTYGITERLAVVPVKKRGMRSDEEPDPQEVGTIDTLINALNGAVAQTAQDVADTTAAKEAAEAAAEAAENYSNIAGQHAQDASASKDAAQIAQTGAETAKADAETSAASARASATDAILLKNQAELAAQNAKQSEDVAVQARYDAIGLKNQAELAAQNASGYADTARMEKEGAEAARDQAGQYTEDARAYAADAEEIKTATEAARDDAIMATSHGPKIENGTWHVWNQQTNAYVDTGVEAQGPQGDAYNLTEDDKAEIATLVDNMKIHICSASEYDSATGIPTIAEPDRNYFYLVPGGEGDNLYIEWVYLNDKWEQFGSATIDLSGYATKADTVLETTLSRGRKEGTTVGTGSIAFGINVEASGAYSTSLGMMSSALNNYSKAEGYKTTASGNSAHAEGSNTIASGRNAHAEGTNTTANAEASHSEGTKTISGGTGSHAEGYGTQANACLLHAEGRYNQNATIYPEWVANTEYVVGDKITYYGIGYICTADNSDAEWNNEHWQIIYHNSDRAFIVGNGTADNARSNAYALDWEGDGHYAGDVYVHANADSTGGTKLATIEDIPDAPVQDVQVNGTSVVENGVANVPVGNNNTFGVYKTGGYGVTVNTMPGSEGTLAISSALSSEIKAGSGAFKPITASNQYKSTFYGLAKAAGADEKDSTLPVGQYTDAAKTAIRTMLGAASDNIIAISDTEPTDPDTKIWIPETATSVQVPTVSEMETALAEKVGDVQVNSVSIVGNDGVANIPIASPSNFGVVMSASGYGTKIQSDGALSTAPATDAQVKKGVLEYNVIGPSRQHLATFYGLSKVAGVDLKDETVTLGTYPEASKTAIKQMLGVQDGLKVVRLI